MLRHETLVEYLHYDPETGVFTWLKKPAHCITSGRIAGFLTSAGYMSIGLKGQTYRCSRLAWFYMTGKFPTRQVDHKDRNKTNDRWENLRLATPVENSRNRGVRSDSASGAKGVRQIASGRWAARLGPNGKTCLGTFATREEAIAAHEKAVKDQYGEFAPIDIADVLEERESAA